jgi:hypothetical protein
MSNISTRLLLGFVAGGLSHVIFQGGLGAAYAAAGLIPAPIWSLQPVPPYGVPVTVNLMFWAGLWGILYALLEPRLTPRLGRIGGGLAIGVAALLTRWFAVLPLKGAPVAEGLDPTAVGIFVGFHLIYGLGLALIYRPLLNVAGRGAGAPKAAG